MDEHSVIAQLAGTTVAILTIGFVLYRLTLSIFHILMEWDKYIHASQTFSVNNRQT